jgi:hypothetical protein
MSAVEIYSACLGLGLVAIVVLVIREAWKEPSE